MTSIETILLVIISIILLPAFCKRLGRPGLLYSCYLIVGVVFGDFLELHSHFMLEEVGKIGFLLLLFLVGLEIELPSVKTFNKVLPFCAAWLCIQTPLILFASHLMGFSWEIGFIAAAGINGCSLGISYNLLEKQKQLLSADSMSYLLLGMVALEVISLILLASSEVILQHGFGIEIVFQAFVLISFLLLIRFLSTMIHQYLSKLVESASKWKIYQILLVIFLISIIGERLGLSAPKTAFFLGLFMKAVTDQGIKFEHELKPIAQDILIPIFFISLGSRISLLNLFPLTLPLALLIVAILLVTRYLIFKQTSKIDLSRKFFLVYCPNLTMAAVASEILNHHGVHKEFIDLLLATGLLMTLFATYYFPSSAKQKVMIFQHGDEAS